MFLFWRLVLGHFLADFTLQANWVNQWKRSSHVGMIFHCLIHPVVYIALTYNHLYVPWVKFNGFSINGLTAIIIITVIHYFEDIWRVYTIKRFNTPDNTLYFIWDQIIHMGSIFIFFGIQPDIARFVIPEPWVIAGILAVGATHFSVVFAYFVDKDLYGRGYPTDREKYAALAERGLAFCLLAFAPNFWIGLIGALLVLEAPRMLLHKKLKIKLPPNCAWMVGSLTALLCGIAARYVLL